MKNKFIQLLALLFLFFTTQSFVNPINKINFIGLNNTSESTLLSLIPFEVGQIFSPYVSDQIIESLFKTGLFENISIVKYEKSLDITLKENPTIKNLRNTNLTEHKLNNFVFPNHFLLSSFLFKIQFSIL